VPFSNVGSVTDRPFWDIKQRQSYQDRPSGDNKPQKHMETASSLRQYGKLHPYWRYAYCICWRTKTVADKCYEGRVVTTLSLWRENIALFHQFFTTKTNNYLHFLGNKLEFGQ